MYFYGYRQHHPYAFVIKHVSYKCIQKTYTEHITIHSSKWHCAGFRSTLTNIHVQTVYNHTIMHIYFEYTQNT